MYNVLDIKLFINTIKKTFILKGRSSRLEFWNFNLLAFFSLLLILIIAGLIIYYMLSQREPSWDSVLLAISEFLIILIVVTIPYTISLYSLSVRRLHDMDYSGWFAIISLIPYINILFWLWIGYFQGTNDNQYGVKVNNP